jgi:hypothetical protein
MSSLTNVRPIPQKVVMDAKGRRKTGLMGSVGPLMHCIAEVADNWELMGRYSITDRPHRA